MLRNQYLELIKNINKLNFYGLNINEHFIIDRDFSFWQMSPINERNLYIQPVSSIIQALAFREILLNSNYDSSNLYLKNVPKIPPKPRKTNSNPFMHIR